MRYLLLALLLVGCDLSTGPEIPPEAVPFDPPAIYETWWSHVEGAAGIERSNDRVRWYRVPGGLFYSEREGVESSGRWLSDGRIFIAEGWEHDQRTVKHEMLHELLQGDEAHEHPLFEVYDARACAEPGGPVFPCPL